MTSCQIVGKWTSKNYLMCHSTRLSSPARTRPAPAHTCSRSPHERYVQCCGGVHFATNGVSAPQRFLEGQRTFSEVLKIPAIGIATLWPLSRRSKFAPWGLTSNTISLRLLAFYISRSTRVQLAAKWAHSHRLTLHSTLPACLAHEQHTTRRLRGSGAAK